MTRTSLSSGSTRTSTRPEAGVNLSALLSRFETICCRRTGSPRTPPPRAPRRPRPGRERRAPRWWPAPLARGGRPEGAHRRFDDVGQIRRLHVEPELPGDHAGDVEQILDHLLLRQRAPLDAVDRMVDPRG